MQDVSGKRKSWLKWDVVIIAAFLAIDDLRNAFFLFLANQDAFSLIVLLAIVWFLRKGKLPKSLGFGGFMQNVKSNQTKA